MGNGHFELDRLGIVIRVPTRKRRPKKLPPVQPAVQRIARVARRAPETMVKVTGKCNKGLEHLKEHLSYITRNGKVVADTHDGSVLSGARAVRELAETWYSQRGSNRRTAPLTYNLMLSMPPGTHRELFNLAAQRFAQRMFGDNHEYVLADHRDTQHTHVHLTVRARGNDGTRLQPRKAELQLWREWLAHELRAVGLEAEATSRSARGVVMKADRAPVHHAKDRAAGQLRRDVASETMGERVEDTHRAEVDRRGSTVLRSKICEAVAEVARGVPIADAPWEPKIRAKQRSVRAAWLEVADELSSKGGEEKQIAADIRTFVASMPAVETEREMLRREVATGLRERTTEEPSQER